MVVKLLTTPIARTTMLCSLLHINIAYVTIKIHWIASVLPDWTKNFLFKILDLALLLN